MLATFVLVFHSVKESINPHKDITKEVCRVTAEFGHLDAKHAPAQGREVFGHESASACLQKGKRSRKRIDRS